ncbi:MAG: hypothetical protein LBU34_02280 [Planctomycetaceae bacterium]|nr:hypothetical protein [Planctomycetaceae bacterium]
MFRRRVFTHHRNVGAKNFSLLPHAEPTQSSADKFPGRLTPTQPFGERLPTL